MSYIGCAPPFVVFQSGRIPTLTDDRTATVWSVLYGSRPKSVSYVNINYIVRSNRDVIVVINSVTRRTNIA